MVESTVPNTHSSKETKENQKLSEQTLSELWKIKGLHQAECCIEKKKFKNSVWHLYLPLPHPFVSLAAVLKTASHIIRVRLWPLVPGEQSRPYSQVIMFVCLNLSRSHPGQLT